MADDKIDIKKAIKHPGALSNRAKHAGMDTRAYAEKTKNEPGEAGKQARFFLNVLDSK